ncbi:MAG: hypothetical protein WCP16_02660 [Pseudanabaena sp. ELA645]|jgi:hypothetical protein
MTALEIAISKLKQLPQQQRSEVIDFIEFLEFKIRKLSQIDNSNLTKPSQISFAEATKDFIGCLDSNLEDLSHNPEYMQGFGNNAKQDKQQSVSEVLRKQRFALSLSQLPSVSDEEQKDIEEHLGLPSDYDRADFVNMTDWVRNGTRDAIA